MIAGEVHDDGDDIVEKLNGGRVSVARVLFSSIFSGDGLLYISSTVVYLHTHFFPLKLKCFGLKTLKCLPNACTCNYSHKCSLKSI